MLTRSLTPAHGVGRSASSRDAWVEDLEIFVRAGALLLVGIALWMLNWWLYARRAA